MGDIHVAKQQKKEYSEQSIKELVDSIVDKYKSIADQIIDYCTNGAGKGRSYRRLTSFCDKFGTRFSGTQTLEDAIDFMLSELESEGFDNVNGEEALVSHWIRNEATAELITPRKYKFAITGLGSSIPTPSEGLEADAIVLKSYEEMKEKAKEVEGKIVIFNQDWKGYEESSTYRNNGAAEAAKYGAKATLIRSLTPFSLYTLHTGWQDYQDGVPKIPSACITIEDADTFQRMQNNGENLRVKIFMNCENHPLTKSRNTIAEITGSIFPEEKVLVSGHMDCWDLGVGAMDDGGGAFISREALSVIKDLNLPRPKRTITMCMFTAEESNFGGSNSFFEHHKSQADKFSIMMESDDGTFTPYGLSFRGSFLARMIIQEIGKLLEPINAAYVSDGKDIVVPDLDVWSDKGYKDVPMGSLLNRNERYFWYHHSGADQVNVQDPDAMDRCTALWAVYAYVIADLPYLLPRWQY